MSLINEALKRARADAEKQAEAERGGAAPAPAWTAPPFARRERSVPASAVVAGLAASVAVALALYIVLHRRAEPALTAGAASPVAAPTADVAAPPSVLPAQPTPLPTAVVAPAPAPIRPAARDAEEPRRLPSTDAAAAREPVAEPRETEPRAPTAAPVATTPPTPAAGDRVRPANASTTGRLYTGEATLPSGARISLGGIISGTVPLAMLNGRMIGTGEFAGDCAVLRIESRRVQLRCPTGPIWIALP